MRVHRIYCPFFAFQQKISLNKEKSHYLINVLRCKAGDICYVFDGAGNECKTFLSFLTSSQIVLNFIETRQNEVESLLKIYLFQALCKGDKMDTIIQKAVELGVTAITPLFTERCEIKLGTDRLEKRMAHWQNIIISAAEQSGRSRLPQLHPPLSLHQSIQAQQQQLCLLFSPHAVKTLSTLPRPQEQSVAIFIGPEGGFSQDEVTFAIHHGAQAVLLGKRILRTETASLAIIASLQMFWGDFS